MKPNYKNWVPKILIVGMAAATAVSIAALVIFGVCGLWVTKTWRIILAIVFAVATIGCGKTLQWSITAYRAFSYDGKRQLSRKTTQGTAEYITLPEGGQGFRECRLSKDLYALFQTHVRYFPRQDMCLRPCHECGGRDEGIEPRY